VIEAPPLPERIEEKEREIIERFMLNEALKMAL
jgi:hypothetical protein